MLTQLSENRSHLTATYNSKYTASQNEGPPGADSIIGTVTVHAFRADGMSIEGLGCRLVGPYFLVCIPNVMVQIMSAGGSSVEPVWST